MNLEEKINEVGLKLYQSTADEDILIARWWDSMFGTEAFGNLVASNAQTLSDFYKLFKSPNIMAYTVYEDRLESVHWAEPCGTSEHAIYFSSWSHPKIRGKKKQLQIMTTIYEVLFSMRKKVVIGITKQEKLLDLHMKLGYVIVGKIPHLFDDDKAWVMYLTEPEFKNSRLYKASQRMNNGETE